MSEERQHDYVVPGWKAERHITGAACLKVLRDMERQDLTVHGFRSTFRDWAAEQTNYPREVALAHGVADEAEASYRRGDLFDKRRRMVNDWAKYCAATNKQSAVTPLRENV